MSQNLEYIKIQLKEYKRKFYTQKLFNGLIISASILLVAFLSIALIEYYGQLDSNPRRFLFFSFLTVSLYAIIKHVALPVKRLINNDNEISDEKASKLIGKFFPDIKDKLLNTIQLSSITSSDNSLALASLDQRSEALNPYEFKQAVDFKSSRNLLIKYLSIPLIIFLVLLLFNRNTITQSTERLVNFNKEYVPQAPFNFNIQNNDFQVFKGDNFTTLLDITGESIPSDVYLNSNLGKQLLTLKDEHLEHTFYNVQKSFSFTFEAAGFNSKTFDVIVVNRPELQNLKLKFEYPRYLNKKTTFEDNISNVLIPEGTKVTWNINSDHTKDINFVFEDSTKIKSDRISENEYSLSKTFSANSNYSIKLSNEHGENQDEISYQVNVIKDKFPGIELERYSDTLLYSYILVGGNVFDDYGLNSLKLFYRKTTEQSNSQEYKSIKIPILPNKSNQNFVYQFELKDLNVAPGEQIDYYLRVWDNDGVNGSKSTKSRLSTFKIPTEKEIKEQLDEKSENGKSEIKDALADSDKLNKELEKLTDQLKTKKDLTWQDKKDIEKVLQKHRKLQSEVENLKEQVQLNNEQKKRFNEVDPETQKKMEQLQKLMEDLVDPETQKLMEELQKLMEDEASMDEINEKLEELNEKDDSFEKELDRTLEMYKKLEMEQKMEETANALEKLSEKQDELNEKTEKAKSKEELQKLEKEQEKLNEEFKEIEKDLEKIEEMNESLENKEDMPEMNAEQKDISNNMEKSSEDMKSGKKKNASQSQKNASDQMKKMAQKMKDAMQSSEMEQMQENIDDLKNIMHNLIELSYQQENIMGELKSLNRKDPLFTEYSQQQIYLERDSKVLEDSLYALAKRVFQLESIITKELGVMKGALKESTGFIKQRDSRRAQIKQQKAMTSMNNLALLLDDLLDNMQQEMGDQSSGDQMCNKPGGSKPKPGKGKPGQGEPGSMGEMQKSINEMIKKLKEGQKQGKGMSKELAKLAARQEMLRRKLGELKGASNGSNPGEGEKGKQQQELNKQLDALEKAMKQTEDDLLSKRLNEKTLKRQQEILTRLLEAENATREQEYDNKREAESARSNEVSKPIDYSKYIEIKERQIELLQTIPPNLSPYYKNEVNEYFDNIEY